MLTFFNLLIVLQIFLELGNTQSDVNNQYQASNGEKNGFHHQIPAIKSDPDTIQYTLKKPCVRRQMPNDQNKINNNMQWIKSSITTPSVNYFVSQPQEDDGQIMKDNNMLDVNKSNSPFVQKLYTLNTNQLHSASKEECDRKTTNQEAFRRSLPDYSEIRTKEEETLQLFQDKDMDAVGDIPELSDDCSKLTESNLNSRRSNTNNIDTTNKNPNTSQDRKIAKTTITDSIDKSESKPYSNEKFYREPVSNYKYLKPNLDQEQINGYGVTEMVDSSIVLMENTRTCYACSSANEPSCWHPDRRTTVKYCRKGHDACITRTYQSSYGLVLTRDCGRTCEDIISFPGLTPNYKSCSVCHYDLCNSAYSFKSPHMLFITLLITLIKYSM